MNQTKTNEKEHKHPACEAAVAMKSDELIKQYFAAMDNMYNNHMRTAVIQLAFHLPPRSKPFNQDISFRPFIEEYINAVRNYNGSNRCDALYVYARHFGIFGDISHDCYLFIDLDCLPQGKRPWSDHAECWVKYLNSQGIETGRERLSRIISSHMVVNPSNIGSAHKKALPEISPLPS